MSRAEGANSRNSFRKSGLGWESCKLKAFTGAAGKGREMGQSEWGGGMGERRKCGHRSPRAFPWGASSSGLFEAEPRELLALL